MNGKEVPHYVYYENGLACIRLTFDIDGFANELQNIWGE